MRENGLAIKRPLLTFYGVFRARIAASIRQLARMLLYYAVSTGFRITADCCA